MKGTGNRAIRRANEAEERARIRHARRARERCKHCLFWTGRLLDGSQAPRAGCTRNSIVVAGTSTCSAWQQERPANG